MLSIVSFLIIFVYEKVFVKSKEKDLLFVIPSQFLFEKQISQEIAIHGMPDVSDACKPIPTKYIEAQTGKKHAFHIALCFEKVVCNIIEHGFKKDCRKNHYINTFLRIEYKKSFREYAMTVSALI